MREKPGLYVHFPFCFHKCHYCDFNSYLYQEKLVLAYLRALYQEMAHYSQFYPEVKTVYVGGGTPTCLSPELLGSLFHKIHKNFVQSPIETTVEANPETLSLEKLEVMREVGVNRLSIGVQSFQGALLQILGRQHTIREINLAIEQARAAGVFSINLDLIYGIPGQTISDWEDTLRQAVEYTPDHLSIYCLTLEEGTPMRETVERGHLTLPEEEEILSLEALAYDILSQYGYQQYEISNFSLPGKRCLHNLIYWRNEDYLGVGAGAWSYLNGERFGNVRSPEKYIEFMERNEIPRGTGEKLSGKAEMAETLILGLRLVGGISQERFQNRFGRNWEEVFPHGISRMREFGLLEKAGENLQLTPRGRQLANEVFVEFWQEADS